MRSVPLNQSVKICNLVYRNFWFEAPSAPHENRINDLESSVKWRKFYWIQMFTLINSVLILFGYTGERTSATETGVHFWTVPTMNLRLVATLKLLLDLPKKFALVLSSVRLPNLQLCRSLKTLGIVRSIGLYLACMRALEECAPNPWDFKLFKNLLKSANQKKNKSNICNSVATLKGIYQQFKWLFIVFLICKLFDQ